MTKLAYLGRHIDARTRKIEHRLSSVVDDGSGGFIFKDARFYSFAPKKASVMNGARVGSVYEIDTEETDDRFSLTWPDWWHEAKIGDLPETDRKRLQAKDATAHNAIAALKTERHPDLKNAVRGLAYARSQMGSVQQAAFDVWVLNQMRRG